MTAAPAGYALGATAEQVTTNGYAVLRRVVARRDIDALRAMLLADLASPDSVPGAAQRVLPRLVERRWAYRDLATSPAILGPVTAILGAVPRLICSYGHDKPAGTGAHTSLHSDVGHLPGVPHHQSTLMVKAAVALTATTAESGATALHPGSHREPAGRQPTSPSRHVELDPGDVLLFHANIRHTATANTTSDSRLGLWFVYALPWMRTFSGEQPSAALLAEVAAERAHRPELATVFGLDDPYATPAYRSAVRPRDARAASGQQLPRHASG